MDQSTNDDNEKKMKKKEKQRLYSQKYREKKKNSPNSNFLEKEAGRHLVLRAKRLILERLKNKIKVSCADTFCDFRIILDKLLD